MTIAHGFAHRDEVGHYLGPLKPPHGIARAAKSRLHAGTLHPFDAGAHACCWSASRVTTGPISTEGARPSPMQSALARPASKGTLPAFSAQPYGPPKRLSSSKRS